MNESKQAPTLGPQDTVRVSRELIERLVTRRDLQYATVISPDDYGLLRAALSTPPTSPDAGRVERVRQALFDKGCLSHQSGVPIFRSEFAEAFCVALDAALATPSATEDAKGEVVNELVALRVLLDNADGSLDNDTDDQFHAADDADLPDDAEMTVRAGTVRKVNRVFSAIDKMLRAAAGNTEREG